MPKIQTLSWFAFTAFTGALLLGFRQFGTPLLDIELHYFLYAGFLFALRLKMALDDHFYFAVAQLKRTQAKIGFSFGIISWFLLIFSAYSLPSLPDSYLLFLLSMGISTLWIIVVAIKEGFYTEQKYWLAANAAYMMITGLLLWLTQATPEDSSPWLNSVLQFEWTSSILTVVLFVIVLIDYGYSKSLEHAQID